MDRTCTLTYNFLCFSFLPLRFNNKCMLIGITAPKDNSSKKNTKKKPASKANHYLIDEETSKSSGYLVEYPMKNKSDP